ncbi:hypothetical protein PCE1_004201 [Barthelona sp. PCE]
MSISSDSELRTLLDIDSHDMEYSNSNSRRSRKKPTGEARTVMLNASVTAPQVRNVLKNTRYTFLTFVPLIIFTQLKYTMNLWFVGVMISQYFKILQVVDRITVTFPLVFVITLTAAKELFDDYRRAKSDAKENSKRYKILKPGGNGQLVSTTSAELIVGDVVELKKGMSVPADCILLKSNAKNGSLFLKTTQLDGETDWKVRLSCPGTHRMSLSELSNSLGTKIYAEAPRKELYTFVGRIDYDDGDFDPLSPDNTLWASTTIASGTCYGLIVYTGTETRANMNRNKVRIKSTSCEREINGFCKVMVLLVFVLSFTMIAMHRPFPSNKMRLVSLVRFIILFSYVIPISMRVNLDLCNVFLSTSINKDKYRKMVSRSTDLVSALGRLDCMCCDKTGTLTKNEMVMKALICRNIIDNESELVRITRGATRSDISDALLALGLCHNVTPVIQNNVREFQGASPDEFAFVEYAEKCGAFLVERKLETMDFKLPGRNSVRYEIACDFPFTSARKRMGIILKDNTNRYHFFLKGAESVIIPMCEATNRVDQFFNNSCLEGIDNMAREGLRTLAFAYRQLTQAEFNAFFNRYREAKAAVQNRDKHVSAAIKTIETDLRLIGVTGIEDALAPGVRESLERFRTANIKVWMLTGDKSITAGVIARSSRLVGKKQNIHHLIAHERTAFLQRMRQLHKVNPNDAILIDGDTLAIALSKEYREEFSSLAMKMKAVVCSRCSPKQKADVVELLKTTGLCVGAVGDGANDVSMLVSADVGFGLSNSRESALAALSADYAIESFDCIWHLLGYHGLNGYIRVARLTLLILNRGATIAAQQFFYSVIVASYIPLTVFPSILTMLYSSVFTALPNFMVILDTIFDKDFTKKHPQVYITKGRYLNLRAFFTWLTVAVYQASVTIIVTLFLTGIYEIDINAFIRVCFTSLVLTELVNILITMQTFPKLMWAAQILSLVVYGICFYILPFYDPSDLISLNYWLQVLFIVILSVLPIVLLNLAGKYCCPSLQEDSLSQ